MPLRNGRRIIIDKLQDYQGFTPAQAKKAMEAVFAAIKQELIKGNDVEIEGLGVLRIKKRNTKRHIKRNLLIGRGVQSKEATIIEHSKRAKAIQLEATLKLEVIECPEVVCPNDPSEETQA